MTIPQVLLYIVQLGCLLTAIYITYRLIRNYFVFRSIKDSDGYMDPDKITFVIVTSEYPDGIVHRVHVTSKWFKLKQIYLSSSSGNLKNTYGYNGNYEGFQSEDKARKFIVDIKSRELGIGASRRVRKRVKVSYTIV